MVTQVTGADRGGRHPLRRVADLHDGEVCLRSHEGPHRGVVEFHGGEQLVAALAVERAGLGGVADQLAQGLSAASGADLVDRLRDRPEPERAQQHRRAHGDPVPWRALAAARAVPVLPGSPMTSLVAVGPRAAQA